jgi:membrane protein
MPVVREKLSHVARFLRADVWKIRPQELSGVKGVLLRVFKVVLIAFQGFSRDIAPLRAAALTLYSLFSIVPVAAMAFGIAKGFGFQERLKSRLLEEFPEYETVLHRVIVFADNLLARTEGDIVAGLGLVFLFMTVVLMLSGIEDSFNAIWKVKRGRTFLQKFTDYLSVMLIAPVFFVIASSITVFLSSQITALTERIALFGLSRILAILFLGLLPFLLIWVLFTFLYMFMPNTRVRFRWAFPAAAIAGVAYQLTQWAYVSFQVGVTRYNAIYGSFAALPLFLTWVQLSWVIVLFGGELSYAFQQVDVQGPEEEPVEMSPFNRTLLSLLVTHRAVKAFAEGEGAPTAPDIARRFRMPLGMARRILAQCVASGILAETVGADKEEPAYLPTRPVDRFTIASVIEALERSGPDELPAEPTPELETLRGALARLGDAVETSDANRLLKDI